MRKPVLLAALAAIPLCSGCGVYIATGVTRLPYQGHSFHSGAESQLGYTPRLFPNWSVAVAYTGASGTDSAAFFVPTCYTSHSEYQANKAVGCHPRITSNASALEVQYRWRRTSEVRPVASVAYGSLRTTYGYSTLGPITGDDSAQVSPFVTLRGGGEFSLASWAHVSLLAGYRDAFRKSSLRERPCEFRIHRHHDAHHRQALPKP